MKGEIAFVNLKKEMAAALTDNGYTVFELLGDEVEIGDIISGDLDSLGGKTFYNHTSQEDIEVVVQHIHVSKARALQIIS